MGGGWALLPGCVGPRHVERCACVRCGVASQQSIPRRPVYRYGTRHAAQVGDALRAKCGASIKVELRRLQPGAQQQAAVAAAGGTGAAAAATATAAAAAAAVATSVLCEDEESSSILLEVRRQTPVACMLW